MNWDKAENDPYNQLSDQLHPEPKAFQDDEKTENPNECLD
jgi:hypothetical protein